jgi:hypothetical protein
MTWLAASGTNYKTSLLDTNAISEISKRPAVYGRGFIERFPPGLYAPCFTPYSLIELRRRQDVYAKFLDFFGLYPCFITKPHNDIVEAESTACKPLSTKDILLYAFTPSEGDPSRNLSVFMDHAFNLPGMSQGEQRWRGDEGSILAAWLKNAKNFDTPRSAPNGPDADRYVKLAAPYAMNAVAPEWVKRCHDSGRLPDVAKLPSLQVMLYNQYYRIFDQRRPPTPQDVTDIRIMACSPYVDAVITERFQADLFTKLRRRVPGLDSIEIARLRDIRWESDDALSD